MGKFEISLLAGVALSALVSATTSLPAHAGELTDMGRIPGTWYSLSVDMEDQQCGASTTFTNGLIVVMLHNWQQQSWFFGLAHPSWRLQKNSAYDGRVDVDGQGFTGETHAFSDSGVGLSISTEFMHAFTAGNILTIHNSSGVGIASIRLDGTTKMVDAVARCSATLEASREQPFGPPKTYSMPSTPFAPKAASTPERGA